MKLKVDDIFTVPINNDEIGVGQIVAFPNKSTLLIIIFDFKQRIDSDYDFEKIVNSRVLFLGYTVDAKLYHKHWKIVGNKPARNIELPYNKIGLPPDDIYIVDYKGKKVRACTVEEFNSLDYQNVIAPVRYENVLKAYYGLQEWIDEDYIKILYEKALNSVRIFSRASK